jgi:hypothetical protein
MVSSRQKRHTSAAHRTDTYVTLPDPIVLYVPDIWIRDEDNPLMKTFVNTGTFLSFPGSTELSWPLWMVIGRLRMRIEQGTATILCKIKNHKSEPLNDTVDDLADLGRTIDQEHVVWTTRSNRMVFSWMDGQKSARTSTWNQGVKNGVRLGPGRYRFESRLQEGVRNWL